MMQLAPSPEEAGPGQQIEGAVSQHSSKLCTARLLLAHCNKLFLSMIACRCERSVRSTIDNRCSITAPLEVCWFWMLVHDPPRPKVNAQQHSSFTRSLAGLERHPCKASFNVQCPSFTSVWRCIGRRAFAVLNFRSSPPRPYLQQHPVTFAREHLHPRASPRQPGSLSR